MEEFKYTPDPEEEQKIHKEGAIKILAQSFQSHEDGLPEWLKNAADAYARENAPDEKRVILVIFDSGRASVKPSISCLDFCGMTSKVIEDNFRIWADPEAATRDGIAEGVQGGHGNGGKCYMTQMFEDYSELYTVKNKLGNRYGVKGGTLKFGYIPNRDEGRDFEVHDIHDELNRCLKPLRLSTDRLPRRVISALEKADGFSLFKGVAPKGYKNRIPVTPLINSLEEHPQMILTLEACSVIVFVNGTVHNRGRVLSLPSIKPIKGEEEPRIIDIPEKLKDPETGDELSTTENNTKPPGKLILETSAVSMRYSKKGRHNVVFKGKYGYFGYVPVVELDVESHFKDKIFGECHLESLEQYKRNDRARLARSPLARAVEGFISEQIEVYAEIFEQREKRIYGQKEKDAVTAMNEALNKWKNKFLNEFISGLWGPGERIGPPPVPTLPTGKPVKIEVELSHQKAGKGVSFRPVIHFYDSAAIRIRPTPYRWVSDDNNVAMVDEDLMIINTFAVGPTEIYAETLDGKLVSNRVQLEVVSIREIRIEPVEVNMLTGSRYKLDAICRLKDNEISNDVYLVWMEDNPNIARVSSAGLVFGFAPGETSVSAGDDHCEAKEPAVIKVVEGKGRGKGREKGKGFPEILISGFDKDPVTGKDVFFGPDEPPVTQRPEDTDLNVWWINSAAPLAKLYLDTEQGYGYKTREWRMYHLERYIEILVQIALVNSPTEKEAITVDDWIHEWGRNVSDIQAAAASDLHEFIKNGELPE